MKIRPIYYDTETTGLSPQQDRIIELAAYDPFLNKTFQSLINPNMLIPEQSTAIHNITNEMVAIAPSFKEAIKDFISFCNDDCVLIAHNNDSFDLPFLKNEFLREEIPMPDWKFIDSLKWARKYRSDLPRHSLQYLREIYQIPANTAHRALDDVIILEKVFKKMINDLDFETVITLLKTKEQIVRMPFGKHKGKPLKEIPKSYFSWLKENNAFEKPENENLKEELLKLGIIN